MCCGGESAYPTSQLNEYGCRGDRVMVEYTGTAERVAVNGNYYGKRQTGDKFCVRPRDAQADVFQIVAPA